MQFANSSVTESPKAQSRQGVLLVLGGDRSGWPGSSDLMPGAWNLSTGGRITFWLVGKGGGHSWQMYQSWTEQVLCKGQERKGPEGQEQWAERLRVPLSSMAHGQTAGEILLFSFTQFWPDERADCKASMTQGLRDRLRSKTAWVHTLPIHRVTLTSYRRTIPVPTPEVDRRTTAGNY